MEVRPPNLPAGWARVGGCRWLAAARILDQGLIQRLAAFERREHEQSRLQVKLFIRIHPRADLCGQRTADSIHTVPGHPTNIAG